jgi:NADPH:quinone reductase
MSLISQNVSHNFTPNVTPNIHGHATENLTGNFLENVGIQGPAGEISLSVARPDSPAPWPAIVIGHEGVGVTEALRGLARRLAAEGYLAVIPDLFTRDEFRRSLPEADAAEAFAAARAADPETAIAGLPEGKRAIARLVLEWFKTRDTSNYLTDFLAATSWAKQLPEVRAGAVAALGFSFGAGLVGRLAAAGADLAAGVVFYGPVPSPTEAKRVRFPLLGHFASADAAINAGIPAFSAALSARGIGFDFEIHAGTRHGFFNDTRPAYDAPAAARAWKSALAFLHRHLSVTVTKQPPEGLRARPPQPHSKPEPEPGPGQGPEKAAGIRPAAYGPAEALVLEQLAVPEPGPGQVLVRNEFAGVNFIDIYQRSGAHPTGHPISLGVEGAGTIERIGPGVEDFRPGDRIAWIATPGSYATHVAVDAEKAIPLPDDIDTATGVAVALQGLTAHALAFSAFPLRRGNKALIHAAAGGVGLLLVQLAKSAGATVFATVSTEAKAESARAAGADHVILYESQNFTAEIRALTGGAGVDVAYDSVGRSTILGSLGALGVRGSLILYGQSSGKAAPIDPQILAGNSLTLSRFSVRHYLRNRDELMQRVHDLFARIRSGRLSVRIDRTLPLEEAAEAHRALEGRETSGKVLLAVGAAA